MMRKRGRHDDARREDVGHFYAKKKEGMSVRVRSRTCFMLFRARILENLLFPFSSHKFSPGGYTPPSSDKGQKYVAGCCFSLCCPVPLVVTPPPIEEPLRLCRPLR